MSPHMNREVRRALRRAGLEHDRRTVAAFLAGGVVA